jgi:hypothetical protein
LHDYILPFLENLYLNDNFLSRKVIDFKYWASIIKMRKLGLYLLVEGKDLLNKISLQMNNRRYSNSNDFKNTNEILDTAINSVLSMKPPFNLESGLSHFNLTNKYKSINKNNKLIYVYNLEGSIVKGSPFKNKSQTAKALLISKQSVSRYLDKSKPFKNKLNFTTILK